MNDPVLGTLTWSDDDEMWASDAAHASVGFQFRIAGTPEPHAALLAHAAEILLRKDAFIAEVLAQIQSESSSGHAWKWYRDEIAGLRVEYVALEQPERPRDGLIGLSGGRDYRCWRCDYTDGKPQGLGFDS